MIRDLTTTLEKATIMEDRIDYANYILEYGKTKELLQSLTSLLDSEETTINIENLNKFVDENEEIIHAFDVEAMSVTEAIQAADTDSEDGD